MMKIAFAAVLAAGLAVPTTLFMRDAAPAVAAPQIEAVGHRALTERQERIGNATVRVEMLSGAKGSGTAISKTLILTAAHVVTGEATATIRAWLVEGDRELPVIYTGKVKHVDTARDLALIELDDEWAGAVARVAAPETTPIAGEAVWISGGPRGFRPHITEGIVRLVRVDMTTTSGGIWKLPLLASTSPADPGNSGGGTFIRRDGEYVLAGVLVAGFNPTLNMSVRLVDIRRFFSEHGVSA